MDEEKEKEYRPANAAVKKAVAKGNIKALRLALTPRQRKFAEEYVLDFNATAAAIRAGYAPGTADKQGHLLSKHEGIAFLIDDLIRSREAKIVSVTPDYVLQRVTDIINKEGAKDGDKLRGLELLARHLGMFIDRTEITGKDGEAIRIEQQRINEEADAFLNFMKRLNERADSKKTVELIDGPE
jgi:phage terminase small subunit